MKKYIKILFATCLIVGLSGCENFLDINTDPNSPTSARVSQLLPTIEERIASSLGMAGLSGTTSFLMQYNVTRGNLNDYIISNNTGAGTWNSLYVDCLTDIREMIAQADANGYTAYSGVGKVLKAYIYSVLVDYWGDVPFSQATQGSANAYPAFDSDQEVYDAVFSLLDEGIADLNKPVTFQIRNDDLIYGGDVTRWVRFANTLKLKLYNQVRLTRNVSSEVNALLSQNLIDAQVDDFEMTYGTNSNPENRNPAYQSEYSAGTKTSPNPYFYEVLNNINTFNHSGNIFDVIDPRIPYYWHRQLVAGGEAQNNIAYPRTGNKITPTGFVSIFSFSYTIDPNEGFDQSASATVMGVYPIGGKYDDASGAKALNNGYGRTPQRLLTFFARKFIEAELAWAGVTSADERQLLIDAIQASFAKVNQIATAAGSPTITTTDRDNYITAVMDTYDAGTNEEKLQVIMTQKWIASYGFAVDAFTDFRRTGYPVLHDGNTDNLPITVRTRDYVRSLVYPDNEVLLNPNAPAQRNPYLDNVFWDN